MRRALSFGCDGALLTGALDDAPSATGLLIVSGGNEILSGSHGGMAWLARRVAAAGFPVLRYDRRGIGDSEGDNAGYEGSADDIAAAVTAFRADKPEIERVVAFGNCDAATSLGLFHAPLAIDALILSNPWVIEAKSDLPPPAAIAARYRAKLLKPSEWLRLARGGVSIIKLVKGLRAVSANRSHNDLADRLRDALAPSALPLHLVIARRDVTALAFDGHWRSDSWRSIRARATVTEIATSSHSFAHAGDADALFAAVLAALRAQAATA